MSEQLSRIGMARRAARERTPIQLEITADDGRTDRYTLSREQARTTAAELLRCADRLELPRAVACVRVGTRDDP